MSKNEFIDRLAQLLADVSPEERDEALTYYREYIEDAGLENEEAILQELGSPEEIAAAIKVDSDYRSSRQPLAPIADPPNMQARLSPINRLMQKEQIQPLLFLPLYLPLC